MQSEHVLSLDERDTWIFGFLNTDISALSVARSAGVRAEAWAVVDSLAAVVEFGEVTPKVRVGGSLDEASFPTIATLSELQQELIDGLDRFARGYHWKIEGPSVVSVARAGDALTRSYQGTFKQLFRVSMLDAFERCQTRLRRCSCQRIFLRVGKQKYCSTACAQKTGWERYKPSRATRDYRAERENAIRKLTGANLRIRGKAKR